MNDGQILEPTLTCERFVAAAGNDFKLLPEGWKFRVGTLDKDLVERPTEGLATTMPDEFFSAYDKTGPDMKNFKP